jgi:hypothetical protein
MLEFIRSINLKEDRSSAGGRANIINICTTKNPINPSMQ